MKKFINVLLILLLCSVSAFSLDWDIKNGILTISGEEKMTNFKTDFDVPWFDYGYDITSVVIEEGVQSIGNNAFYDCDNLKSITIPESVQSVGNDVFKYYDSLQSITIPEHLKSYFENVNAEIIIK